MGPKGVCGPHGMKEWWADLMGQPHQPQGGPCVWGLWRGQTLGAALGAKAPKGQPALDWGAPF